MRLCTMCIEGRLIIVNLEKIHRVRFVVRHEDAELLTAGFFLYGMLGVVVRRFHELVHRTFRDGEFHQDR